MSGRFFSRKGKEVAKESKSTSKDNKFQCKEGKQRCKEITLRSAPILEKMITLEEEEFDRFMFYVVKYGLQKLAQPNKMLSLDIVKQFYANSIVSGDARTNCYTWVN
ncbi:hypothetical protein TanjilG_20177 [Lupinus angustifolius]|uniref:Uncharacterized protein n=1 Tax=Lupinus angustifolius TaxID=3871 RepID=A0A1J7GQU3_LUPAN|nr:hypothetical protein TanjilG_20177 [Lupinus angustifolius]